MLLCGPLDEEIYQAATKSSTEGKDQNKNSGVLQVDRAGIRATRLQIDTLTAQIEALDARHSELLQELEDQTFTSDLALEEANAEVQKLTAEMENCRSIVRTLEADRRRSLLNRQANEAVRTKMANLSIENVVALVRLTSLARGFLGRARVKRIKATQLAQDVGILSAMANTVQGKLASCDSHFACSALLMLVLLISLTKQTFNAIIFGMHVL